MGKGEANWESLPFFLRSGLGEIAFSGKIFHGVSLKFGFAGAGGGVLRRARGCTPWQALRRNAPASVAPATMVSSC